MFAGGITRDGGFPAWSVSARGWFAVRGEEGFVSAVVDGFEPVLARLGGELGVAEEFGGGEGESFGGNDHAFAAEGGAGGGGGHPGVERGAGREGGGMEVSGGDDPTDVADVGGGVDEVAAGRLNVAFGAEGEVLGEVDDPLAEGFGEGAFLGGVADAAGGAEIAVEEGDEGGRVHHVAVARGDFEVHGGAGGESAGLGGVEDALPDGFELALVGVAGDQTEFGGLRDDVGGVAAFGDDVVDPGLLRDVFAEEVEGVGHDLDAVESGAPGVGGGGGVGGASGETEFAGDVGEPGVAVGFIAVEGVPGEDDGGVLEGVGADQVDLAAAAFLGGGAVEADGAGGFGGFEVVFDGDGGEGGGGAEEVVAAAMAGSAIDAGLALGDVLLGETGEGVVFADDADNGGSGAPFGDEGGRDAGHVFGDAEAVGLEFVAKQGGAFELLVAGFGVFPDLAGDLAEAFGAGIDGGEDGGFEGAGALGRGGGGG